MPHALPRARGGHGVPTVSPHLGQGPHDGALHDAAQEDEVEVRSPGGARDPHQVVQDLLHGWGEDGGNMETLGHEEGAAIGVTVACNRGVNVLFPPPITLPLHQGPQGAPPK